MKIKSFSKLVCIIALTSVSLIVNAQETNKVTEPEYNNTFCCYNQTNGALIPLEKNNPSIKEHVGFAGYGAAEKWAEVDGEKSPVRFKANEKLEFVVKLASQENDPQTQISFFSWQSLKGKRQIILSKGRGIGPSRPIKWSENTAGSSAVPFNAEKYGQSSFKFSPTSQLAPGEYFLGVKGIDGAFCFGIDSAESSGK